MHTSIKVCVSHKHIKCRKCTKCIKFYTFYTAIGSFTELRTFGKLFRNIGKSALSKPSSINPRLTLSSFFLSFFFYEPVCQPWILLVKIDHTRKRFSRDQLCISLRQGYGQFFAGREILSRVSTLWVSTQGERTEISRDSRMNIKTRHTMNAAVRCLSTLRCRICGKAHGSCHRASQWNYRKPVGDVYDYCRFNPASYIWLHPAGSRGTEFCESYVCSLTPTAGLNGYIAPCKLERMHNATELSALSFYWNDLAG